MQVVDLHLAIAGVEGKPYMHCMIKDINARLTGDSSSQQLLEKLKPRMGAHLPYCEHSGMLATTILLCMHRRLDLPIHDSSFVPC